MRVALSTMMQLYLVMVSTLAKQSTRSLYLLEVACTKGTSTACYQQLSLPCNNSTEHHSKQSWLDQRMARCNRSAWFYNRCSGKLGLHPANCTAMRASVGMEGKTKSKSRNALKVELL